MTELNILPTSAASGKESLLPPSAAESPTFFYYLRNLATLSMPNIATSLTFSLQGTISLYFMGHTTDVAYLDAYALANAWTLIFGLSITIGLATGLSTLVSQSFGRGDFAMCGHHLNRGFVAVGAASVPCCILVWVSGFAYRLMGIDERLAEYAYKCTVSMLPLIVLSVPMGLLERFMLAQRIAKPQMIIQIVNICLFPLYCYIFIDLLGMNYVGASIARVVMTAVYVAGMAIYLWQSEDARKTLVVPSRESFRGCREYLQLAVPTMLMMCFEWWAFAIMNFYCGRLGILPYAAYSVTINIGCLIFKVPAGIAGATGTFVGNSIGERNVHNAKRYIAVGTALAFVVAFTILTLCVIFRRGVAEFYTTDKELIQILEVLIFYVAALEITDGIQVSLGRSLIGMGKQSYAAMVNLFSYYVVMIPLAIVAGSVLGLGVTGVLIALIVSNVIVMLGYSAVLYRVDWEQVINESEARATTIREKV